MYTVFVVKEYSEVDVVMDFFGEGGVLWSETLSAELLDDARDHWERRDREKSMVALSVARASADARVRYSEVRRDRVPAVKITFFDAHGARVRKERRLCRVPKEEEDAARAAMLREMNDGARAKLTPNAAIPDRIEVHIFDGVSVKFFWKRNNTMLLSIHASSNDEAAPSPHIALPAPLPIAAFPDSAWKAAVLDAILTCSALSPSEQNVLDVEGMRDNARYYLDTWQALNINDRRARVPTKARAPTCVIV